MYNGQHFKKEDYRGYEIFLLKWGGSLGEYFYIAKDGDRASILNLRSVKACKTVIDTYIRSRNYPIYK